MTDNVTNFNYSGIFHSCSSNLDSDDSCHSASPPLRDVLTSTLSDVSKNFNVVHINAQSISAYYMDMLSNFDNRNIHAILVSETWLNPSLSLSHTLFLAFS